MNIIVTGASQGIGYQIVKQFSQEKSHKIIAISRNKENLQKLLAECNDAGSNSEIFLLPFDLLNLAENEENFIIKIQQILENQNIDILINNAGTLINKAFIDFEKHEIEKMLFTNYLAPVWLIKTCLPIFNPEGSHIINISSMGGFQGSAKFAGLSIYSSSKAALANITECLAEEYKHTNLKFNCLCLGAVQTEMLQEAFPGYKAPLEAFEIASFIVDFAQNGCKYFNGKIIPVSLSTP